MTHRLDWMSRIKDASGIKEVYIKRDQWRLTVKQECQEETIGIWRDRSLGRSLNKSTDRLRVGQPKANQWAYSQEGL